MKPLLWLEMRGKGRTWRGRLGSGEHSMQDVVCDNVVEEEGLEKGVGELWVCNQEGASVLGMRDDEGLRGKKRSSVSLDS